MLYMDLPYVWIYIYICEITKVLPRIPLYWLIGQTFPVKRLLDPTRQT